MSASMNQSTNDPYMISRKRMVKEQLVDRGITDTRILDVMSQVHRHDFVDEALKRQAYIDAPLSIGESQTISQPYIVALMTQALQLTGVEKVLEVGTGCGYQTVILSHLCTKIYTIERFQSLGMEARTRFKHYGLKNVVLRIGDGSQGWPTEQPFDRILLACASPQVPEILIAQLAVGGKLVVPVTVSGGVQNLLRITKTGMKNYSTEDLGACHFVKLVGKYGYPSE